MQARDQIADKLRRVIVDASLVTENFIEEEFRINNSVGAAHCFKKLGAYIGATLDNHVTAQELDSLAGQFPVLLVWGAELGPSSPKLLRGDPEPLQPVGAMDANPVL